MAAKGDCPARIGNAAACQEMGGRRFAGRFCELFNKPATGRKCLTMPGRRIIMGKE